jgi:hypothetical protein
MNFAHSMVWRQAGSRIGEFRVSVRADYRRLFDVDFEILQNPTVAVKQNQAYLPYWPVPGLIKRSPDRTSVNTIAYAGRIGKRNIADMFHNDFPHKSAMRGLSFKTIPPQHWHDMSGVDILVAIRDFVGGTHKNKPPSKLFNAWLSEVPLVAGVDSAFRHLGEPGVDYIRVAAEGELWEAIYRLCTEPVFYKRLVEAGRAKAASVTHEKIAETWLNVLEGPVYEAFERWKASHGEVKRRLFYGLADKAADGLSVLKRSVSR